MDELRMCLALLSFSLGTSQTFSGLLTTNTSLSCPAHLQFNSDLIETPRIYFQVSCGFKEPDTSPVYYPCGLRVEQCWQGLETVRFTTTASQPLYKSVHWNGRGKSVLVSIVSIVPAESHTCCTINEASGVVCPLPIASLSTCLLMDWDPFITRKSQRPNVATNFRWKSLEDQESPEN